MLVFNFLSLPDVVAVTGEKANGGLSEGRLDA